MRRIETLEEGQSRGRVREIYDEMERAFAAPFVGSVFRALAAHPKFLESAWAQLKPNVETQAFIDLSAQIRQRADALAQVTFELADLYAWLRNHNFNKEDIRRILYALEALHYTNPKFLLATAAMTAAVLGIHDPRIRRRRSSPVTSEEPEFPTRLPRVMFEQAPNEVKEDYLDAADVMGTPVIPDDFQALGHWPAFLRRAWAELKPVVRSTTFLDEAQGLSAFAFEAAQELPHRVELREPEKEVRRILETFLSIYSRASVGTAAIRWMLIEGQRTARTTGRAASERPTG